MKLERGRVDVVLAYVPDVFIRSFDDGIRELRLSGEIKEIPLYSYESIYPNPDIEMPINQE